MVFYSNLIAHYVAFHFSLVLFFTSLSLSIFFFFTFLLRLALIAEPKKLVTLLRRERGKVAQAKSTIGSLIQQISEYQGVMEEEKSQLEAKLKGIT